jgi:hypothetical protein
MRVEGQPFQLNSCPSPASTLHRSEAQNPHLQTRGQGGRRRSAGNPWPPPTSYWDFDEDVTPTVEAPVSLGAITLPVR